MGMDEIDRLKKDRKKAESKGDWKEYSGICNYLGQLLYKNGDFEAALAEHKMERKINASLKDLLGVAIAHRRIGECHAELQQFSKALSNQEKHLKLAQQIGSKVEEQRAWATIGRTYYMKFQIETENSSQIDNECLNNAQKAFLRALDMCEKLKADLSNKEIMEMKSRLLLNLGLIFDERGQLEKGIELIKRATFINDKYEFLEDLHRCQYSVAVISQRHGKLTDSLRYMDQALSTATKMKNKVSICEALFAKSEILASLGDFCSAKNYLKRALKIKSPVEDDRIKIENKLKIVYKLYELETSLLGSDLKDAQELMNIYENMADGCVHLALYELATKYYLKMLNEFEKLENPPKDKTVIYSSLAHTYLDNKQYLEALNYFKLELECNENNLEEKGRTLINMGVAAESLNDAEYKTETYYKQAYQCLSQTSNKKLLYKCLESLLQIYEINHEIENVKETRRKIAGLDVDEMLSDDDDEEAENEKSSQDVFQQVNLADISDITDSENEETNEVCSRAKRRKTVTKRKVNEMGETPLHRACITGNLKAVRQLLNEGHPVNTRDYCGWLPIHEAANHGFHEILLELVEHGAWINDRGGKKCEGVTPLHDAASCGNFEIMKTLIANGASVVALTNCGESPLESLMKWRKRSQSDLDKSSVKECMQIEAELQEAMDKVGQNALTLESYESSPTKYVSDHKDPSSSDDDESSPPTRKTSENYSTNDRPPCSKMKMENTIDKNDAKKEILGTSSNQNAPSSAGSEKSAAQFYQEAISHVRRSASSRPHLPCKKASEKQQPALVNEDEVIGQDWLVEDVKDNKRIKYGPSNVFATSYSRKAAETRLEKSPVKSDKRAKRKRALSPVQDEVVEERHVECDSSGISDDSQVIPAVPEKPSNDRSKKTETTSSSGPPIRLKIRVQDKLLLVPVPLGDEKRVSWLALEISNRYYLLTGLRPVVSLSTSDGAMLCPDDLLLHLVSSNEELLGKVESWDLPPLPDRYKTACKALGTFVYGNVKTLLQKCQTTHELILSELSLGVNNLRPVFRAIQHHNYLQNLAIDGNKLGDEGLLHLIETLPSLPSLTTLKINGNNLTARSVQCLANLVSVTPSNAMQCPLQLLKDLDLSCNSLTDASSSALGTLLAALPNLQKINVSACQLTMKMFQQPKSELNKNLSECVSLTTLVISDNDLSASGVDLLLRSLNAQRIVSLDLTAAVNSGSCAHMCHALGRYLVQDNCSLEELSLADCNLNDEGVQLLSRELKFARRLSHLSLARNIEISLSAVSVLLGVAQTHNIPLNMLDLSGCSAFTGHLDSSRLHSENGQVVEFANLLKENNTLRELRLSLDDASPQLGQALQQTWLNHWGNKAVCKVGPGYLLQFNVQ